MKQKPSAPLRFRQQESGSKKEFQRSTKSVLRNVDMRGKLTRALGIDVGVGIDTVGSMDRPISTIGSPLPPPRSSSKKTANNIGDVVRITYGKYKGKEAKIVCCVRECDVRTPVTHRVQVRQGGLSSRWN